jgi:hypothetical protein
MSTVIVMSMDMTYPITNTYLQAGKLVERGHVSKPAAGERMRKHTFGHKGKGPLAAAAANRIWPKAEARPKP